MNLEGVPDSIPIAKVRELMTALGLPIDQIPTSGCVHIGWTAVTCEVYALDANGRRYIDEIALEPAKHQISIAVDHLPEPERGGLEPRTR